jgi:hypothetical protein
MEQVQLTTFLASGTLDSRLAAQVQEREKGAPYPTHVQGRDGVPKYILSCCDATCRSTLQPLSKPPARHTSRPMSESRFLFCRNRALFAELCSEARSPKTKYTHRDVKPLDGEAWKWDMPPGYRSVDTVLVKAAIAATYSCNREKP